MDRKKYDTAFERALKYKQEHLLKYIDELSETEKGSLLSQIESIDYDLIEKLYKNAAEGNDPSADIELKVTPLPCSEIKKMSEDKIKELEALGNKAISEGKVCAVTVAGGQGTRLGHDGPKGTFSIGLPSNRSLFNILCDKLSKLCRENNSSIPWYIMTSTENNMQTVEFFKENNYFGYPEEDVVFFIQGMLPIVNNETGKILLRKKNEVALGADGHGGVFNAMLSSGVLADMEKRGIEYVFLCGIDNVLVQMANPLFVGFTIDEDTDCASKGIIKRDPYEKAGVFCYNNGKPAVVEYTELNDELRFAKDDKDEYKYGNINILNYVFKFDVLKNIANMGLPYHTAFKKAPYVNEEGNIIKPEKENGYKFETFIFDAFTQLKNMSVLRGVREEEFAPVKNMEGEDSPETARALMFAVGEK